VHHVHLVDPNCHKICDALLKAIKAAERRGTRSASVVAAEGGDDVQEEDEVILLTLDAR
jgi:hypothetical protein